MVTNRPLRVKTKVSDPGRSLKPLFNNRPVQARIVDWIRSADTPRFWATHASTFAGTCWRSLEDHGSISGWTNCVANVKTDRSSAAEIRVTTPAVVSPRRAADRSGPLTITAAAAISTTWGGVNRTSRPSVLLPAAGGQ